jgi:hypothetical protein
MPRHNENARPRDSIVRGRWSLADLKAMSEHLDRKIARRGDTETRREDHRVMPSRPLGVTLSAEQIVRDFRKAEGLNFYQDLESMRPLFKPPHKAFFLKRWINAVHPVEYKDAKFSGRTLRGKKSRRHGFLNALLHGVNWDLVFNWMCWAVVIFCVIFLGFFVFGPFTVRLLR